MKVIEQRLKAGLAHPAGHHATAAAARADRKQRKT
jgi:hypothetical protein